MPSLGASLQAVIKQLKCNRLLQPRGSNTIKYKTGIQDNDNIFYIEHVVNGVGGYQVVGDNSEGGCQGPKGRSLVPEGPKRGRVFGEGAESPLSISQRVWTLEERCKLPHCGPPNSFGVF